MDAKRHLLKTAVYIDGYNLYYGRLRGTPYKWLNVVALFQHIVHTVEPSSAVLATKFYTAPALARFARHGDQSMAAQNEYHRALESAYPSSFSKIMGSHVFERNGTWMPRFVAGQPIDRSDIVRVWRLVEKKTDVNLALGMYRDSAKGLYDQLVPTSASLARIANWTRDYILDDELARHQLSASVPTRKKPARRPAHW